MTHRMITMILLLLAGVAPIPAGGFSQSLCTIEAVAVDGDGAALENVEAILTSKAVFDPRSGFTGALGRCVFFGLPAGTYRVEMGRDGFQWAEVEDFQCPPGAEIRIAVVLEAVDYEEVVVFGSGPVVEAGSPDLRFQVPEASSRLLPRSPGGRAGEIPGEGSDRVEAIVLPPASASAWCGRVVAGPIDPPAPHLLVTTRPLEARFRGEITVEAGRGSEADELSTRGSVDSLRGETRVDLAAGSSFASGRLQWFLAAEGRWVDQHSLSKFSGLSTNEEIRQQHDARIDASAGLGALRFAASPPHELGIRWSGRRRSDTDRPATLYVAPGSPVPASDVTSTGSVTHLSWSWMADPKAAFSLTADHQRLKQEVMPLLPGVLMQDQTVDGTYSDGIGNGVWLASGGVPVADRDEDRSRVRANLQWSTGRGHTVAMAASWVDTTLSMATLPAPEADSADPYAAARTYRGWNGSSWTDQLLPQAVVTGDWRVAGLFVGDRWRALPGLTLNAAVFLEDVEFATGSAASSYRFGIGDTLSSRLGLVWDFEGNGRSRLWVNWSRTRPHLEKVIHRRLMGAFDMRTTFDDGVSGATDRPSGELSIEPGFTPARRDETVFGVEYEVLSRVVVGGAVVNRRLADGVATLSLDRGWSFEVGSPSGEMWSDSLWNDQWQSIVWVRKQLSAGWQAEFNLQWSKRVGTWSGSSPEDIAGVDREWLRDVIVPETLLGASGPLPDDRRWSASLRGSWTFRNEWVLGSHLSYRSGAPFSRLGAAADSFGLDRRFVDQRGAGGRTASLWQLDALLVWPVDLGAGVLEARLEVLNLLNSQSAIAIDERWSLLNWDDAEGLDTETQRTSDTWGNPLVAQRPREVRIGFNYSW